MFWLEAIMERNAVASDNAERPAEFRLPDNRHDQGWPKPKGDDYLEYGAIYDDDVTG